MPYLGNGEPLCVLWIGNFFRPEYDDEQAMSRALEHIKRMGFNGFSLDSKSWRDFDDFYNGAAPSHYVKMQLYAIDKGKQLGLPHMFLALYLNGDNLYNGGLRESPPIYGEQPIALDGKAMPTYKYWSPTAQEAMLRHVRGLIDCLGDNHLVVNDSEGRQRLPIVSMFEPWIVPSFDAEGQQRYRDWLREKYGTIDRLNAHYGTSYHDFSELRPEDYWFGAAQYRDVENMPPVLFPAVESLDEPGPDYLKFVDNQLWRDHECRTYFQAIERRFDALPKALYLMPILSQWQNVFASGPLIFWRASSHAVDPWGVGPFVHSTTFNTMPSDGISDPNAYVVSAEMSISRSANRNSDFVAGLDICRFLGNDVYRFVPPGEVIATTVLQGAQGLHVYGYNGLDDGGSLKRMPAPMLDNVSQGLAFFKVAANRIRGKKRKQEVAIVYPRWMALFAPVGAKVYGNDSADYLGWFQYLSDQGYQVDTLHSDQVERGFLTNYRIVVLPWEPYYRFDRQPQFEKALADWVMKGGTLLHGAGCSMLSEALNPEPEPHHYEGFKDDVYLLPCGFTFESFRRGEVVVPYTSGKAAAVINRIGQGTVLSIGFNPGLSYIARLQPFSAGGIGINEVYQFSLAASTFLSRFLRQHLQPTFGSTKGVEYGLFEDAVIAVNHNPYAVPLFVKLSDPHIMLPGAPGIIPAHGAIVGALEE